MLTEVSVLLPVYNIDAVPLAEALHRQAQQLLLRFEILVYDDCSTDKLQQQKNRESLKNLPQVVYKELEHNKGRSAIRNQLAQDARFAYLLFIDADSDLPDGSFLKTYAKYPTTPPILVGGTIYRLQKPTPELMLRWTYGHSREARSAAARNQSPYGSFTLNNLLIARDLFLRIKLNEAITTYGHEDTLFGEQLQAAQIPVLHIDNPVVHTGLEPADVFLQKTEDSVNNLWKLYQQHGAGSSAKLLKAYQKLKQLRLEQVFLAAASALLPTLLANLRSATPNMRLFDLYKLYLVCKLADDKNFAGRGA